MEWLLTQDLLLGFRNSMNPLKFYARFYVFVLSPDFQKIPWPKGRYFSQRCDFTSTIDTVFKYQKLKPYWIFKGLMRKTSNLDSINDLSGETERPFALNTSFPLVYQGAQNSFHQHSPVGISFDNIQKLLETSFLLSRTREMLHNMQKHSLKNIYMIKR